MTETEFRKKAGVIERKLKRGKVKTLSKVGPKEYDMVLDEFAKYWANPETDIRESPDLEGAFSRLTADKLMDLLGLDVLTYAELLEEYRDYATSMLKGRNFWSCLYDERDPVGTVAGISVGGWLVRRV